MGCLLALPGCSWFLPKPDDSRRDPGLVQCPLDVAQLRKERPVTLQARGVPALLIIRKAPARGADAQGADAPGADRIIRNGQSVYFIATHHDENRTILSLESKSASPDTLWRVEAIDAGGIPPVPDSPLSDTSLVRLLRPGSGYLDLSSDAQGLADLNHAESITLFKADVPDSTRPTTCDEQLRDGDFVFLRTSARQSWVGVSDTGAFFTGPGDRRGNRCDQPEERCLNDQGGGLVCAWTTHCTH
jgi:hypothetical protein